MWKLFPSSWLEKAGLVKNERAADVATLESRWRERLELALRRVAPGTLEECELDPVRALRALSGRALLSIDEALRRWPSHSEQLAPSQSARAITPDDEGMIDAYLFVAACDRNGFIRQQALTTFARYPCSLALAAGLIRSTDWVQQVRDAGITLVNAVLPRLEPSEVVHSLELPVRLADRVRAPHDFWQTAVMPVLMTPAGRAALWAAVRDQVNSSELRRAAFEFLARDEAEDLFEVLSSAVADPDPRVGLWALSQAERLLSRDQHIRLLKTALAADHAAVRRTALRFHAAAGANDSAETLRAALFDVSRGVRGFAAFELKRAHDEDALPVWRLAIESPDRRRAEVALAALCELGNSTDVERLAADIGNRNATTRAGILRGLWRAESSKLESVLAEAMFDRSKVVLRQVGEIYRRASVVSLDASRIDGALARADGKLAPNLFALAHLLGKWAELEFLLVHAIGDDAERAESAADRVDHWVRTESRRFTAPSSDQMTRIESLSAAAQARHSGRRWGAIHHGLSVFRKT